MKRMSYSQKVAAVVVALEDAKVPLSTEQIGKKVGFQSGKPVQAVLLDIYANGLVNCHEERLNTGTPVYYWALTYTGRKRLQHYYHTGDWIS